MPEEVRCPMCSKLNPAGAEQCGFCGARLKPLVAGAAPPGASPPAAPPIRSGADDEGGGDDWLARMRSAPEPEDFGEEAPQAGEGLGGSPDWLGRLREVGPVDEGPPAGEIPDWLGSQGEVPADAGDEQEPSDASGAQPGQIPDWLARVRDRQAQEGEPVWEEERDQQPAGSEDWLARIRESGRPVGEGLPSDGGRLGPPSAAPGPEELSGLPPAREEVGPPGAPSGAEEPDLAWAEDSGIDMRWLEEAASEIGPESGKPPAEPAAPAGWLSELEGTARPSEGPAESGKADWLGDAEIVIEKPFTEADAEIGGPEPGESDWLKELEQGSDQPSSWQDQGQPAIWEAASGSNLEWLADYDASVGGKAPEESGEPVPAASEGAPDWLSELNTEGEPAPSEPAEVPAARVEAPPLPPTPAPVSEEALPHVPALVFGAPEKEAPSQGPDFDLGTIEGELPDWLGEQKAGGLGGEPDSGQAGVNLAPATLPAWLEAMRPISTFRSVVDTAEEEEATLESAGPLAGLRGVLMAEPVMAMPRAPTIGSAKLEVTERQYNQAEILHQMVEEEELEAAATTARRRRVPFLRWIVSAVMLAAVILPITTGVPSFPLPSQVSRDLQPLIGLVNGLPVDRPALIVFDFDPGYSAEMDAVAGALLDQVMARGIPVVSLSTRPSGPALAVGLLGRIAARHSVSPGTGYMHLGYLSGGSTAVQIFAASPRDAVRKGFDLPKDEEGEDTCSGWDCPILAGVQRLSDFGMVAVISSGTENARVWAEQAHPFMGQVPLVMILSAGAEPLIRPYYEALQPQVNGILSGLPAAVAYEQANVLPGEAHSRWNPFGAALAATEVILAAGVVYGLARWFLRISRPRHE